MTKPIFSLGNEAGTVLSCIPADSAEPTVLYGRQAQVIWDRMCAAVPDPWAHERTETMSVMVWRAVQKCWSDSPDERNGLRVFDCSEQGAPPQFYAVPSEGQDMLDIVWLRIAPPKKLSMSKDNNGRVVVGAMR